MKDGEVTVGKNINGAGRNLAGSSSGAAPEPDVAGDIHLHPFATTTQVDIDKNPNSPFKNPDVFKIYGGHPSSMQLDGRAGDIEDHQRRVETGESRNGVRSIVVDAKNIYLYNSSANQTITIPRP